MRRLIGAFGLLLVGLGLFVALLPVVSVWRVSGQVLRELPEISGSEVVDERHRFALSNDDFLLATRSYGDATVEVVRGSLVADGFEPLSIDGEQWLSKPCCGEYDAVWVHLEASPGQDTLTVATLTVADSDIQLSWPIITMLGTLVLLAGAAVTVGASKRKQERESGIDDELLESLG